MPPTKAEFSQIRQALVSMKSVLHQGSSYVLMNGVRDLLDKYTENFIESTQKD